MGAGLVTAAISALNLIPPIGNSLLLGTGIGLFVAAPVSGMAMEAAARVKVKVPQKLVPREKTMDLVEVRRKTVEIERKRALDTFDAVIERVSRAKDADVIRKIDAKFATLVDRLTRHYPEWDGEGRLRTYFLLKGIADSLDSENAEAFLNMAFRTLQARGNEAADLSRITLNGKVERLYRDTEGETARRLAGTLLLMNRGDEYYAQEMVVNAIHLWSDARFEKLKDDFAAVPSLGLKEEERILQLLEKEICKAGMANDTKSADRAKELLSTISKADPDLHRDD